MPHYYRNRRQPGSTTYDLSRTRIDLSRERKINNKTWTPPPPPSFAINTINEKSCSRSVSPLTPPSSRKKICLRIPPPPSPLPPLPLALPQVPTALSPLGNDATKPTVVTPIAVSVVAQPATKPTVVTPIAASELYETGTAYIPSEDDLESAIVNLR